MPNVDTLRLQAQLACFPKITDKKNAEILLTQLITNNQEYNRIPDFLDNLIQKERADLLSDDLLKIIYSYLKLLPINDNNNQCFEIFRYQTQDTLTKGKELLLHLIKENKEKFIHWMRAICLYLLAKNKLSDTINAAISLDIRYLQDTSHVALINQKTSRTFLLNSDVKILNLVLKEAGVEQQITKESLLEILKRKLTLKTDKLNELFNFLEKLKITYTSINHYESILKLSPEWKKDDYTAKLKLFNKQLFTANGVEYVLKNLSIASITEHEIEIINFLLIEIVPDINSIIQWQLLKKYIHFSKEHISRRSNVVSIGSNLIKVDFESRKQSAARGGGASGGFSEQ